MSWETSFVAMSAALAVDADDALAAIGGGRDPEAKTLALHLKSASKAQRAQALAVGLGPIAREVAAAELGAGA